MKLLLFTETTRLKRLDQSLVVPSKSHAQPSILIFEKKNIKNLRWNCILMTVSIFEIGLTWKDCDIKIVKMVLGQLPADKNKAK